MSERATIAFLTGCMFVVGLHLRSAGRLLVEGWSGPYRQVGATTEPQRAKQAADIAAMSVAGRAAKESEWKPGQVPGL